MNALILAAGRGTRLALPDDRPKCLVEICGRALLDAYLDELDALGASVTLVVGHEAQRVGAHVERRARPPRVVENTRYGEGSVISLAVGMAEVHGPVLTLDGDVAFPPGLLRRLHDAPATDALLVDVGTRFTDEQYMAGLRGGRVVRLLRGPATECDEQGEWVGFAKLGGATAATLRARVDAQVARGDTTGGYEDALAALLADFAFAAVPTGGAPWVEIDFPADLERARSLFAPGSR